MVPFQELEEFLLKVLFCFNIGIFLISREAHYTQPILDWFQESRNKSAHSKQGHFRVRYGVLGLYPVVLCFISRKLMQKYVWATYSCWPSFISKLFFPICRHSFSHWKFYSLLLFLFLWKILNSENERICISINTMN